MRVEDEHWIDVSIDVRRRVEPKLPAGFIGSPIVNIGIITTVPVTQSPGKDGVDIDLAEKQPISETQYPFSPPLTQPHYSTKWHSNSVPRDDGIAFLGTSMLLLRAGYVSG